MLNHVQIASLVLSRFLVWLNNKRRFHVGKLLSLIWLHINNISVMDRYKRKEQS
jgi:hypothetical protein